MILALGVVPGSAVADPSGDRWFWMYTGITPTPKTNFGFTYNDPTSPLQYFALQVNGSTPSTYQWTQISVRVDGTVIPNACLPLTGTAGGIGCQFGAGQVSPGATISLFSDANPTIPENTGGVLVLQNQANQVTFGSVTGPTPATPGKPSVAHVILRGMIKDRPHLEVALVKGENAPGIKSFEIRTPLGLSWAKLWAKEDEKFSAGRCWSNPPRELKCKTKAPESMVEAKFKYAMLGESKSLAKKVKHHEITELSFPLQITDAQGHVTHIDVKVAPH